MRYLQLIIITSILMLSCKENSTTQQPEIKEDLSTVQQSVADFTLVFASCADQDRPQPLWAPINDLNPDLFVWGGDNIYADTQDMAKMETDYNKVWSHPEYQKLALNSEITGTWDDHDYGENDAGVAYPKKQEAQALLLDFLKVPEDDARRNRAGVYTSKLYETSKGSVNLILLDTRFFRDDLKPSNVPGWRYEPWGEEHPGTMLGAVQWQWLEEELNNSQADFNIIVSSIQLLSKDHGWEKWANFPAERQRLLNLITTAKAKNIMVLSGDRHMAEISVSGDLDLPYPLIDFTTSGLTHTWLDGATEANEYRVSNVVKQLNFGVLFFDFSSATVRFEIRGEDGFVYERFTQQY